MHFGIFQNIIDVMEKVALEILSIFVFESKTRTRFLLCLI